MVANQAVDVHLVERHVAHELDAHHDHARDPEENDVESGDEHISGIEVLERVRLLWPAERAEWPQGRGEPGIENVLVLSQGDIFREAMMFADSLLRVADVDIALVVIPGRDAVPPPELPADTPVLDVVHPVEVGLRPVLGNEANPAGLDGLDRGFRERLDLHVPLIGEVRLDNRVRAIAARNLDRVILDLVQQPQRLEFGDDLVACDEAVESAVGLGYLVVERRVVGQDVVHRQVMALADFVVIEIVRRRYLDAAGAELGLDVVVGNNRDLSADDGEFDFLAHEVTVALVVGVHGDGAVAQHGFGAGRRDDKMAVAVSQRIAEMPEFAGFVLRQHLEVGQCRVQDRIPIHEALAPVDQSFLVQGDEDLAHGR